MTGRPRGRHHPTATSPARHRWLILLVAATAQLLIILDSSIVNIALPRAADDLDIATLADTQWVVTV